MFNVGGGEFLVILLIALIVLGPQKLPEAAKQIGGFARELRRMSNSFQNELKHALDDPVEAQARERGRNVVASEEKPAPTATAAGDEGDEGDQDEALENVEEAAASNAEDGSGEASTGDEPAVATSGPDEADQQVDHVDDDGDEAPQRPMSTAEAAGMYDLVPVDSSPDLDAISGADNDAADADEATDEPDS